VKEMNKRNLEEMSGTATLDTSVKIHGMENDEFSELGLIYPTGEYNCNREQNCIWFTLLWFGVNITIWPKQHSVFNHMMSRIIAKENESEEE